MQVFNWFFYKIFEFTIFIFNLILKNLQNTPSNATTCRGDFCYASIDAEMTTTLQYPTYRGCATVVNGSLDTGRANARVVGLSMWRISFLIPSSTVTEWQESAWNEERNSLSWQALMCIISQFRSLKFITSRKFPSLVATTGTFFSSSIFAPRTTAIGAVWTISR